MAYIVSESPNLVFYFMFRNATIPLQQVGCFVRTCLMHKIVTFNSVFNLFQIYICIYIYISYLRQSLPSR